MRYQFIVFFLGILLIASCSQEKGEVTANGLEYKLFAEGSGEKPAEKDYVSFHMTVMTDATEAFNSRLVGQESMVLIDDNQPGDIRSKAIVDVMKKASVGDSIELFFPRDSLASLGIPDTDTMKMLTYRMRVTKIQSESEYQAELQAKREEADAEAAISRARMPEIEKFVDETYRYIVSGKGGDNIQTTETGLQYIIHEEGSGDLLDVGKNVTVHYYGVLKSDGKMFDSSFRQGNAFTFPLGGGRVIRGWDEGVALLKKGTKATLIIPYNLGYGEAGSPPRIPPRSDLIFYIEVPE